MVTLAELPVLGSNQITGYRLVNSKFPPIAIFDDVASAEEFEAIFELQALTNPRLRNTLGDLNLVPSQEIPFGIAGCAYAVAPFTHVNPAGSRFSDGSYGVLYTADGPTTALREVAYHQEFYWKNVPELHFDRIVLRALICNFDEEGLVDGLVVDAADPIYSPSSYAASQALGRALRDQGVRGLRYRSVRSSEATCWGLFSPNSMKSIVQAGHYEMIWNGSISSTQLITTG